MRDFEFEPEESYCDITPEQAREEFEAWQRAERIAQAVDEQIAESFAALAEARRDLDEVNAEIAKVEQEPKCAERDIYLRDLYADRDALDAQIAEYDRAQDEDEARADSDQYQLFSTRR